MFGQILRDLDWLGTADVMTDAELGVYLSPGSATGLPGMAADSRITTFRMDGELCTTAGINFARLGYQP